MHYQRSFYFDYKLSVSQNYINILVLVSGLVNLFLLVPDLAFIESAPTRIAITIIRIVFSAILFVVGFKIKSIRTFKTFSIVLSLSEILALAIFLFVFSCYSQPNFLIQTMGIITIIIITFLLPNRWIYMLIIALSGSIGFFVCSSIYIETIDKTEYMAAISYVAIAIFLCALSARNAERHQFREFTARTELERLSTTDFLTDTSNRYKLK